MKIFTDNLSTPEAPVLLEDGSWVFTEMGPERGCITHISADGKSKRVVAKTGRPNGLTLGKDGYIWVAETAMHALLKLSLDGTYEIIAESCNGERFVFLNDLAFAPNGDLYMTDSGIHLEELAPGGNLNPNYLNLNYNGKVYKINVNSRTVELIDHGIRFANGLAFGPDNNLYVAETMTGTIYRYKWVNGRIIGGREYFGSVVEKGGPEAMKGPDGFKFGTDGNLYSAVFGQGDVTVLDKKGNIIKSIKTDGMTPSNLAFGKPGECKIYVTEDQTGTIQVFDVDTDGFTLYKDN